MGVETNQLYVLQPLPSFRTLSRRPFEAATSGSGTVKWMRIESGSSDGWSFTGHHTSAPMVWQLVATHGAPLGVRAHVKPPSQGGFGATRGRPPYCTRTRTSSPGCRVTNKSIHNLPSRRSYGNATPDSATPRTSRRGSRSRTNHLVG